MRKSWFLVLGLVAGATSAHAAIAISAKPTKNMSCSAGVCIATSTSAVLNASDLETMLASSDVAIETGAGAVNIGITAPLAWSSASRLTLHADASVNFRAPVIVQGPGGMTIETDAGAAGGDFGFSAAEGGHVAFWDLSSSLVVNGITYTLVGDLATLHSAAQANAGGHYALANNYDAGPDGTYTAAPVSVLGGAFEGLGNAIDNLRIRIPSGSSDRFGLIAWLQPSGTARDIALTHVEIVQADTTGLPTSGALVARNQGMVLNASASGTKVRGYVAGGLVGLNDSGTVSRSHASIDLPNFGYGFMSIGGLVGRNDQGTISQSYATGNVTGGKRSGVGGLVGYNDHGLISQSYALGSASASPHDGRKGSEVGGLVGHDVGTISQSYSTGPSSAGTSSNIGGLIGVQCCHPGFTTASYWDITTSGSSRGCGTGDCSGVTGLTDTELKSGLPAGFDPAVWGSSPAVNGGLPYLLAQPPQ